MNQAWLQCLLISALLCFCRCFPIEYNTEGGPVEGKLNVHLVPHTHDDVGWLKTVDQYYTGSNSSIQVAAVQYILDSFIDALQIDPNRKFIYVEVAFFKRWWREQSKEKREIVRKLVDSGQLEFINGGWCMHDEASTYYVDMIDQTTLGHRFIKKEFGMVPRIGWQIDPFGHSAVQAYLLSAEVGFDALFFARADYQDIAKRREDRTMEMIWRASKSLGSTAQVFTGILSHHYDPPPEFRYDIKTTETTIQDDPFLYDYNVEERVDLFVQLAEEQAKQFRTNHIMWTMGEDFAYENANTWFKQMDKLIHYVNKDGRVNVFYSTPTIYTLQKHAANESWPLKTDDFFPYADCEHCYWTGYFTSRPALKGYVRKLSGLLQAARQLEFIVGRNKGITNTDSLEEAMAVLQHHDGVSGTEKQHVANDYALRLSRASIEAEDVMKSALVCLMSGKLNCADNSSSMLRTRLKPHEGHSLQEIGSSSTSKYEAGRLVLEQCPLLNISYCPKTESKMEAGTNLAIVIYNPLGWTRNEVIKLPVSSSAFEILDSNGSKIQAQFVPIDPTLRKVHDYYATAFQEASVQDGALFNLYFEVAVPSLGYVVYFMKATKTEASWTIAMKPQDFNGDIILDSTRIQMVFSNSTGLLKQIRNYEDEVSIPMQQSFCWYNGSDGNTGEKRIQASGAYVFRPNSSSCFHLGNTSEQAIQSVMQGDIVTEIYQQFSPWVSQVVRLYKNADDVEIDFLVGPIPIDDNLGKEIVARFMTNISSSKEFYTDSNGRDFLKRIRNYRKEWDLDIHEEIAGNYYPVNLGMYLKDNETDFSLLVDRSLGGSSIFDGELELMLHRRLLHDDGRGVGEALNESICLNGTNSCEGLTVQGKIYLNVGPVRKASEWRRTKGLKVALPLQISFATLEEKETNLINIPQYSALPPGYELPPNIAIITLQELEDKLTLLRLAHLYEIGEDDKFSTPARVDLQNLFPGRKIEEVVELNLSGVQKKSEMTSLDWRIEGEENDMHEAPKRNKIMNDEYLVELAPMEIRTFQLEFDD
ncbi:hypothetical protein SUGI_1116890 [Cryptomeria japonica]|uniref:alpha-mannosidase n=1 Tax=Cryptomeria japonica TaxID=3369 RepID=UPI00241481A7|nr:alpha-mannosidase [Cryptomeria japonica]GLJ52491.1 hypothetical protein SUGI_1116890 [Cryptomeria japonica]